MNMTEPLKLPKWAFVILAALAWLLSWWVGTGDFDEDHILTAFGTFLDTVWPTLFGVGLAAFVADGAAVLFGDRLAATSGNR